jgi:hypothetical protein
VAIPRAGDRYPVWYDPADPSKFGLGTEVDATAAPDIRALFARAGRVPGGVTAPAPAASAAPAASPPPELDWVEQLGRLNELRLAGALSDEEFELAKQKLLSTAQQ